MQRTNPTFKTQTLFTEDAESFINELFDNLFNNDDISEQTDRIPDLGCCD